LGVEADSELVSEELARAEARPATLPDPSPRSVGQTDGTDGTAPPPTSAAPSPEAAPKPRRQRRLADF
ncbi:MAG: hypothetical protein ACREC5_04675, partial [Thermoplasmata archaeon]